MSDAEGARGTRPSELVVSGVALSVLSLALVLDSANEEPFTAFRWPDLARIVGLGTLAFLLFATWAFACVRHLRSAPQRGALFTGLAGAAVLWTAINLFYLGVSIYGYTADLNNPLLHVPR